jgi:hypothetical protein
MRSKSKLTAALVNDRGTSVKGAPVSVSYDESAGAPHWGARAYKAGDRLAGSSLTRPRARSRQPTAIALAFPSGWATKAKWNDRACFA